MVVVAAILLLVLISTPLLTWAELDADTEAEIQALTTMRMSLCDLLGVLAGWDPSTPVAPCDWRGIGCYSRRVSELRLPRLHLRGSLSPQIANLRMLRKLNLRSNFLNGTIPVSLFRCSLFHSVFLQDNLFTENLSPEISNHTNLLVFNVAGNRISCEIPGDLPQNIRFLDLSSNAFFGEIPRNISNVSQLQLINLSYNQISGKIPAGLGELENLQYLWLDYNSLEGTLSYALASYSALVHFSAECNTIGGVLPATIGALPKLGCFFIA